MSGNDLSHIRQSREHLHVSTRFKPAQAITNRRAWTGRARFFSAKRSDSSNYPRKFIMSPAPALISSHSTDYRLTPRPSFSPSSCPSSSPSCQRFALSLTTCLVLRPDAPSQTDSSEHPKAIKELKDGDTGHLFNMEYSGLGAALDFIKDPNAIDDRKMLVSTPSALNAALVT